MPASSTSATGSPACSRWRATTTRATSSPIRAPPPASAAFCATSSPWARGRSPASMRCRFGDPEHPKTRHLVSGVVAGIGGYGNSFGVPTVGGSVRFHARYDGNNLVNAMAVGIAETDKIFYAAASGVGMPIVYLGSKTGRDGIHGATHGLGRIRRGLGGEAPDRAGRRSVLRKAAARGLPRDHGQGLRHRHPGHGRGGPDLFGGGDGRQGRSRRHARSRQGAVPRRPA